MSEERIREEFTEPSCKIQCEAAKDVCRKTNIDLTKIPSPVEVAEKVATQQCAAAFELVNKWVLVSCAPNPVNSQLHIDAAKEMLIKHNIVPANWFENVQIRFCKLLGEGQAPDRNQVLIDESYLHRTTRQLAILLAHEMKHIDQYRSRGSTDQFKCDYSRHFVECAGCQDDGHPEEAEAYAFEEAAANKLP